MLRRELVSKVADNILGWQLHHPIKVARKQACQ